MTSSGNTKSDIKRTAAELLGGTIGGMLQAVIGHPLDTLKVRMQTSSNNIGVLTCFKQTIQHEGVRGFFKGLSTPLCCAGLLNAVIFSVNGMSRRAIASVAGKSSPKDLSPLEVIFSAWMTAPIYSFFVAPVEVIKTRLQIQKGNENRLYKGPIDVIFKSVKTGGIRELFRGYATIVMMRAIGLPFYFSSYTQVKKSLADENGKNSMSSILVAGGAAGISFWTACFPVDTIKSKVQTSSLSIRNVISDIMKTHGFRGFYRGYLPCILRAAPANMVAFWGLETTLNVLGYSSF